MRPLSWIASQRVAGLRPVALKDTPSDKATGEGAIERWNSLSDKQNLVFAPIDPDFVIELLSPTDNLLETQQKMMEYQSCGVKLGWLINPDEKQVEIYRLGKDKQAIANPSSLSGEDILPGLTVDLSDIF